VDPPERGDPMLKAMEEVDVKVVRDEEERELDGNRPSRDGAVPRGARRRANGDPPMDRKCREADRGTP